MTTSEAARHLRAEIQTIMAGLRLEDLALILAYGRKLAERDNGESVTSRGDNGYSATRSL